MKLKDLLKIVDELITLRIVNYSNYKTIFKGNSYYVEKKLSSLLECEIKEITSFKDKSLGVLIEKGEIKMNKKYGVSMVKRTKEIVSEVLFKTKKEAKQFINNEILKYNDIDKIAIIEYKYNDRDMLIESKTNYYYEW